MPSPDSPPASPLDAVALESIAIDVPCKQDWNSMRGDDRTRFCGACKLHVHDLSEMTRTEATELLQSRGERLCVRLFRRPDGTVITKDCRTVLARARRRMKIAAAAVVGALGLTTAAAFASTRAPSDASSQTTSQVGRPGQANPFGRFVRQIRNALAPPAVAPPVQRTGRIRIAPVQPPVAPPQTHPRALMGEVAVEELGDVLVPPALPIERDGDCESE